MGYSSFKYAIRSSNKYNGSSSGFDSKMTAVAIGIITVVLCLVGAVLLGWIK
jgi:hypothetical protein